MEYVTSGGVKVSIGRVDRRVLDAIDIQKPQPPTREADSWGDITAQVPIWDDPDYARQLSDWRVGLFKEEWFTIAPALDPQGVAIEEARALQAAGFGEGRIIDVLRYTLTERDQIQIVSAVYYQSTVTDQAVFEAEERFGYTWLDKPVSSWSMKYAPGQRGQLAVHWRAALRSRLTWEQFCALPGPEQSTHVAFWSLEDQMSYLLQNYANNPI